MGSSIHRRRLIFNSYIESILITIFISLTLRYFVISPYKMPTDSMAPTILKGDFIFAYTLPYGIRLPFIDSQIGETKEIRREQVVLFRYKIDDQSLYIKRIWGLPGDKIEISKGRLKINDREIISTPERLVLKPILVPPDSVFLMGDNPQMSDDLQYWSLISKDSILGNVTYIWFSVNDSIKEIRWDRIFKRVN